MTIERIETRPDGVEVFRLRNERLEAKVCTYGGALMGLWAKDRDGVARDVVLGYETPDQYFQDSAYLGLLVGRVANRIAGASFTLNGVCYELPKNDGENCLHGGPKGISYRNLTPSVTESGLRLSTVIPDMEDGFPGTLNFSATYSLDEDCLSIRYEAVSDRDTIVNFTSHAYFNLSGTPSSVENHLLTLNAPEYCPVDEHVLASGEHQSVENTPFDFRKETRLGERLNMDCPQLKLAGGIDHSFVLSGESNQIKLYNPENGLELSVSTHLPQVQIYTSNMLTPRPGKGGTLGPRKGICFETQFEPNSINSEKDSPSILRAGERFDQTTVFQLRVR